MIYRGFGYRGIRVGGIIFFGILESFFWFSSYKNFKMLLFRVLILFDFKRVVLILWRFFYGIRFVDFGSYFAVSRRRFRVFSFFRGVFAFRSGLRGVRGVFF